MDGPYDAPLARARAAGLLARRDAARRAMAIASTAAVPAGTGEVTDPVAFGT